MELLEEPDLIEKDGLCHLDCSPRDYLTLYLLLSDLHRIVIRGRYCIR